MDFRPPLTRQQVFTDYYCPIEAGYKDRSGVLPYDRAVCRALESAYKKPADVTGSEERTLFVGRLPHEAEEADLEKAFSRYGELRETRLIRDLVTGAPRGYGFVVFARRRDAVAAHAACRRLCIAGADVVVEAEFSRGLRDWKPRRLGGGLGGKKESGQLRFGGVARQFQVLVPVSAGSGWLGRTERAGPTSAGTEERTGRHHTSPAGIGPLRDGAGRSDGHRRPPEDDTGEPSSSWDEDRGARRLDGDRHRESHRNRHGEKHRERYGGEGRDHRRERRSDGSLGHRDRHGDGRSGRHKSHRRDREEEGDRFRWRKQDRHS